MLVGEVPACQRHPALRGRCCWGPAKGQGEGRSSWKFRKSWLNLAQRRSLWDICFSLALSCLALEVLEVLPHWAQWVTRQQGGEGSWSLKHINCGHREQGTSEVRVTTDWRSKCNFTSWFQGFGPSYIQEASRWGHSQRIGSKLDKRGICCHFWSFPGRWCSPCAVGVSDLFIHTWKLFTIF